MSLDFHYSFGFRNSKKSIAFCGEGEVVFAAGRLSVSLDMNSGSQKHFQFTERPAEISAIAGCGVLIAGAVRGRPPSVCLFNTLSETKKFYAAPASMKSEAFTSLSVSNTLKFLAAQGGPPDQSLVIWWSHTQEIAMTFNPAALPGASVDEISFHAGGRDELVVVGNNVFRLYEYQGEAEEDKPLFVEIVFEKFEKSCVYQAIGWPEREYLAVGSSGGQVLFFRGIELVTEVSLEDDLKRVFQSDIPSRGEENGGPEGVTSVATTTHRLLCAFSGFVVLIYEGEEIANYALAKLIEFAPVTLTLKPVPGEAKERPDRLLNLVASQDGRDLVATTRDGQMLRCVTFANGGERHQFTSLLRRQHTDPIIEMDVARCRPLIATASRRALILWNFSDKKQELRKLFRNEIRSVAIHPSGLYVALGFDHCCRLFSVLHKDLREQTALECKGCSLVGFSSGGHLLAVVSGSAIGIYSFATSLLLFKLDDHAGRVTSFDWIDGDTKLASCDIRGVVCEWDLTLAKKNWEVTSTISYAAVTVNPSTGNIIVVGSDKTIRCFDKSLLQWNLNCRREATCVICSSDSKSVCVGTSDGCLEFHSHPASNENVSHQAHSGRISGMKYNSGKDFLISCGSDGSIFLWKTVDSDAEATEGILSKLCLVDASSLASEQEDKLNQLRLSLKHMDAKGHCEFEMRCIKHAKALRTLVLDHEREVDDLNERLARIKEDKQKTLFDSDPEKDQERLDSAVRREIIDTTIGLQEAYKRSSAYVAETDGIVSGYESEIGMLSEQQAKFSCAERDAGDQAEERIRALENTLMSEKEVWEQSRFRPEEYAEKLDTRPNRETVALIEDENSKSDRLRLELEELEQLTEFTAQDTKKRRNVTAGQVDHDVKEKVDAVTLSRENCKKLESVLQSLEKACQKREKKFCDMRKTLGGLGKFRLVSETTVDEWVADIEAKNSEIESCRRAIEEVGDAVPSLAEEIDSVEEMFSTAKEKWDESAEEYRKKQKAIRNRRHVASKYTAMLQRCFDQDCDVVKLRRDIETLFEEEGEHVPGDAADNADPLLSEFHSQIESLKNCYDRIKGEPKKASRDKSAAEFRLSMENSKVLQKVREVQGCVEKLGQVISEMEWGLGAQAKSGEVADLSVRDEMQYVVEASEESPKERSVRIEKTLSRLDRFAEEQEREIERFRAMLDSKLK